MGIRDATVIRTHRQIQIGARPGPSNPIPKPEPLLRRPVHRVASGVGGTAYWISRRARSDGTFSRIRRFVKGRAPLSRSTSMPRSRRLHARIRRTHNRSIGLSRVRIRPAVSFHRSRRRLETGVELIPVVYRRCGGFGSASARALVRDVEALSLCVFGGCAFQPCPFQSLDVRCALWRCDASRLRTKESFPMQALA